MNKLFKSPRQRAKAVLFFTAAPSVLLILYFITPALLKGQDYLSAEHSNSNTGSNRIHEGSTSFEKIELLDPLHLFNRLGMDLIVTEVSEPTETQFEEGIKQIEQSISVEGDFQTLIHFQFRLDTLRSNCRVKELKIFKVYKTDRLKGEFRFTSLYPMPVL